MGLLAVCSQRVCGPVFVAAVDKTGDMTEEPTPGCTWGEEQGHAHDARRLTGPSSAPFVSHPTSRLSHGPWEDGVLSGEGTGGLPLWETRGQSRGSQGACCCAHPSTSAGFSECLPGQWVSGLRGQSRGSQGSHREADPCSWCPRGEELRHSSCLCEQKPATSPLLLADLVKCLAAPRSKESLKGRNRPSW